MSSLILLAALAMAPVKAPTDRLIGDWILNLYIGHSVFDDEVTVRPGTGGALGGTLTVPGRFTAELRNVVVTNDGFTFEIVADEGRGPFRVHYAAEFHGQDDVFVGFATLPDENHRLLGGFAGRRR
jgi:hypothetical protein